VTDDKACVNTVLDWVTDRENVGLFNMASTNFVVQKLTNVEMRAIYFASVAFQPTRNASLVYDLMTLYEESALLREAVKYHLLHYAASNSSINQSDPEYDMLRWMAEYIRYYRIYLAEEANKMMNVWLAVQAYADRLIALYPAQLAPPFRGYVTNSYLIGNTGYTTLAVTENILTALGFQFAGLYSTYAYQANFVDIGQEVINNVDNLFASADDAVQVANDVAADVEAAGQAVEPAATASDFALAATGPAAIILAAILIGIQEIIVVIQNQDVIASVNQGLVTANQPYDVTMLISDIQSRNTGEFATAFAAAAAGPSKACSTQTTTTVLALAQDLCNLTGPLFYNNTVVCNMM